MKTSIIISYYKNQANLSLILKALNKQTSKDFEVIVSEDDNDPKTKPFLDVFRKEVFYPILHTNQQEDLGFRKTMMLNKSIKVSNAETLIFIDGDCVPHKRFVEEYIKNTEDGYMLLGRRVMLSKEISEKALQANNPAFFNLKNILCSSSNKKKEVFYSPFISLTSSMKNKGLLGCNWGIKKKHLIEINGFDEDYVHAAVGEDTDVDWRLRGIGIKGKSVKNKAIVYHVFHERGYSQNDVNINKELLKKKLESRHYKCINGLEKYK